MGKLPRLKSHSLACEKCVQPGQWPSQVEVYPPFGGRAAGCLASKTRCLSASIRLAFLHAFTPQSIKTRPSRSSFNRSITASVKHSQPNLRWLAGFFSCTVSIELSKSTPCSAYLVSFPLVGKGVLKSSLIALKMVLSERGKGFPPSNEKLKPCACPSLG